MTLRGFFRRENLGDPKFPREQRPRPGINPRVAKRGAAFRVGVNRWSAGTRPGGFVEKRRSGRSDGATVGSIAREE